MSAAEVLDQRIDELLERWARWRRRATRPPTGGYRNALAGLVAEGATVDRGSRQQEESERNLAAIRAVYDVRIATLAASLARALCDPGSTGDKRQRLADELARLRKLKRQIPKSVSGLAWASLIQGRGSRPDPEHPEEEAVELAVCALRAELKRVIEEEYLRHGTQDIKARAMRISRATYQRYLYQAQREIRGRLGI